MHYHRIRGSKIETVHVCGKEVNGRPVTSPKDKTSKYPLSPFPSSSSSEMNRIVVLSDASKEFPNNTTNAFKVRLPNVVRFDGTWEVGLASISIPDVGVNVSRILDDIDDTVLEAKYHVKDSRTSPEKIELKTSHVKKTPLLQRKSEIVDGVGFMKELIEELDRQVQKELVTSNMEYAYDTQRPTFRWEGEELILERKKVANVGSLSNGVVTFLVQFPLAYSMGWIQKDIPGKVTLGPNLEYSFSEKDNKRMYRQLVTELSKASGAPRYWKYVPGEGLYLSQTMAWRFKNLNVAFGQLASQKSQTLFVYSDVGNSNFMGDSEHPLIREVHYRQDGSGVVYFEPIHIQWMPMHREYLDVIEVSLGESNGNLADFAKGNRTIVTFQFWARPSQQV